MLLSREMDFPWIKKQTNMKFNQKHYHHIKELKNLADLFQIKYSHQKLVLKNLSLILIINFQDLK